METARTKRMKEAKKEAAELESAFRAEKETSYKASMQKVGRSTPIGRVVSPPRGTLV